LLNAALPETRLRLFPVQIRFIALLKPPFKTSDDYPDIGWGK
jgi:hypothetical protein